MHSKNSSRMLTISRAILCVELVHFLCGAIGGLALPRIVINSYVIPTKQTQQFAETALDTADSAVPRSDLDMVWVVGCFYVSWVFLLAQILAPGLHHKTEISSVFLIAHRSLVAFYACCFLADLLCLWQAVIYRPSVVFVHVVGIIIHACATAILTHQSALSDASPKTK